MKINKITILILLMLIGTLCYVQIQKNEKLTVQETEKTFKFVTDFPIIKDTTLFIAELRQTFDLEIHESPVQKENEKITVFKKIKLYGSDEDYFLIEYDWIVGCMAEYPWKYQLLLTGNGKLVKILSGARFDFVTIFPNQNPFLLILVETSRGNGGHELYKISADTLENVYEGYFDYNIRTCDAYEDNRIYEPNELILNVKDFNNDGFNDISFSGKIVLIQGLTKNGIWYDRIINGNEATTYSIDNPFMKIPIEFIFLYDKQSKHFKAKENYSEKYGDHYFIKMLKKNKNNINNK